MENRAIVYTKDDCTWCVRVKRLLEDNKYAVTEMPIQDGLQWLNKIAPHPVRTVPQVIMNNEYIGGFAEVEKNKVTILCNGAEEASLIDATSAQTELEKATFKVEEAATKKEKIEATIELRKAKARLQAVA